MLPRRRFRHSLYLSPGVLCYVGILGLSILACRRSIRCWANKPSLAPRAVPPVGKSIGHRAVAVSAGKEALAASTLFPDAVEVEICIPGLKLHILEANVDWQERLIEEACEAPEDSLEADPYGMAIWPAAQVLAQAAAAYATSLRRPGRKARVLELGAGCGLASLTLAALGVDVLATDFRELPLQMLEESARRQGVADRISTQLLDICNFEVPLPDADLILAADVLYDRSTAKAMARRAAEARARGSTVLISDIGRPNSKAFFQDFRRLCPSDAQQAKFSCHGMAIQGRSKPSSTGALETEILKEVKVNIIELPGPGPAATVLRGADVHAFAIRPEGHDHVL